MPDKNVKETRTTIDSMLELLRARGRMDINSITAVLNIAPTVVEGWAKVLESGGLARITYDFGRMFVEPFGMLGVGEEVLKAQSLARKTVVEQSVETQNILINRINDAIRSIDQATVEAEREFSKQQPSLRKSLEELNRLKTTVELYKTQMQAVAKGAETDYSTIMKKIEIVSRGLEPFTSNNFETTIKTITKRINEIIESIKNTEMNVDALSKGKDSAIEEIKKGLSAQIKELENTVNGSVSQVNSSYKQYKLQMDEELKNLNTQATLAVYALKQLHELIIDGQRYAKRIDEHKGQLTEKYAKVQSELRAANTLMTRKSDELTATIDNLIKKFGSLGEISTSIELAKSKRAEVEKEIASMMTELKGISGMLSSIGSEKGMSEDQRVNLLRELGQKSTQIMSRIEAMRKSLSGIETGLKGA